MARWTVERLYAEQGWVGALRRTKIRTPTWASPRRVRPTASVFGVFSRRIVGRWAATLMATDLMLNTLEHAIWTRR